MRFLKETPTMRMNALGIILKHLGKSHFFIKKYLKILDFILHFLFKKDPSKNKTDFPKRFEEQMKVTIFSENCE